ncbi:MAG: thiamine pyrophosphate-dependent enzyme, partial [Myxococcota bacterium]|nr:thiamine pyrophosphate-dependent enzyme [Myxococcota bacterium]
MDTLALRSLPPLGVLRDDGTLDPAHTGTISEELAVALYEHMVVARTLDERVVALQREGVVTQYASAAGEEAAILGAVAALNDDDWVFPSSREIAAALWRGMPLAAVAHHLFGTADDAAKGRDAPHSPFWRKAHIASTSPLVGTQIPHAVGFAWAAQMQGQSLATLVFFGEGATSTGDFHAGLNFAGVTRAPVVALCRNNGWAMTTPVSRQTASDGIAVKSVAYGLDGVQVDGTDIVAVLSVVRAARQRAVAGHGGTLIEAIIPGLASADPLARTREHLEARNLWSGHREEDLRREVRTDVDRVFSEALSAAKPGRNTLFDDVYAH